MEGGIGRDMSAGGETSETSKWKEISSFDHFSNARQSSLANATKAPAAAVRIPTDHELVCDDGGSG
jgi:hypothetical protein